MDEICFCVGGDFGRLFLNPYFEYVHIFNPFSTKELSEPGAGDGEISMP